MSKSINVSIVRSSPSFLDFIEVILDISAWIVMLMFPLAWPKFTPGYWRCLAIVFVVQLLAPSSHRSWTSRARS